MTDPNSRTAPDTTVEIAVQQLGEEPDTVRLEPGETYQISLGSVRAFVTALEAQNEQ